MHRSPRLAALALVALAHCAPSPAADAGDSAADSARDATVDDLAAPPDASGDAGTDAPADVPPQPYLAPYMPAPRARFPANFLWGSATAPFQIEGGLGNTNWGEWERRGHIVNGDRSDDGAMSLTRYEDDLRTLTETSQNSYRFGIEWARLFPTRESWERCSSAPEATRIAACRSAASPQGLAYYHQLLASMRTRSITPLATIQHFTLPDYIDDLSQDFHTQGWLRSGTPADLATYAGFVAAEYGGEVDWWVTINEPLVVATVGYLDGRNPPGQTLQIDSVLAAVRTMIRSHAAMFDAIHRYDTTVAINAGPISPAPAAFVSIAQHVRRFFPYSTTDARDARAADRQRYLFNELFVNALTRGDLDENGDGMITGAEPRNDPTLRNRLDYLGINYYSLSTVRYSPVLPLIGGLPLPDETDRGLPKTDFGWDIYPRGFQDLLEWAGTYNLPVVVTENGLADAADVNRPRFLVEHLGAMAAAMAPHDGRAGVRVVGYFHWSTVDNFEWIAGYCPRFGLYRIDPTDPMRRRVARPSAELYQQIIREGEVSDALLRGQPACRTPERFCGTVAMTMMPVDAGR